MDAETIIHNFGLEPLPHEGGWFRRVFTHDEHVPQSTQGPACGLVSMIYYMITHEGYSAMHRLVRSSESFHWHAGDPLEQLILHPDGGGEKVVLGNDFSNGQVPSSLIPKSAWQGARLASTACFGFAFMTVNVAPEFMWEDFELGDRDPLIEQYPDWTKEIEQLTR